MSAMRRGSTAGGVLRAALLGGPIFVTGVVLASMYNELPKPITVESDALLSFPILLLASAALGGVVAGAGAFVGSQLMAQLADHLAFARMRVLWLLSGAAIMAVICWFWVNGTGSGPIAFGLIIAGAACGWLSQGSLSWEESDWEKAD